jgi:hypothetical protein
LTLDPIAAHVANMIRLTLPDGTRTHLGASEITYVEPVAGGSLIHRAVGEPMKVMQDSRTIQTRINTELDAATADVQDAPAMVDETAPEPVAPPALTINTTCGLVGEPATRMHRLKRLMQGRVSGMALTIAQMK